MRPVVFCFFSGTRVRVRGSFYRFPLGLFVRGSASVYPFPLVSLHWFVIFVRDCFWL